MRKHSARVMGKAAFAAVLAAMTLAAPAAASAAEANLAAVNGWQVQGGERYWYDNGVMARSKEVYDPGSDAWYWFDADGTMAHDKDAYLPSSGGKWVRYDGQGHMIKGEDFRYGGWYLFDTTTGAMQKGVSYVGSNGGKWVYYDVITGQMAHGLTYINYDAEHTGWYYFDPVTGAMAHGNVYVSEWGKTAYFDNVTGIYSEGSGGEQAPAAGTVYWTKSGKKIHKSADCPTLSRSKNIYSGSVEDANRSGKYEYCKDCS